MRRPALVQVADYDDLAVGDWRPRLRLGAGEKTEVFEGAALPLLCHVFTANLANRPRPEAKGSPIFIARQTVHAVQDFKATPADHAQAS